MTRDDIIKLAMEADVWVAGLEPYQSRLEHFAALVAAAEREACAKVCEAQRSMRVARRCAAAIRARGYK